MKAEKESNPLSYLKQINESYSPKIPSVVIHSGQDDGQKYKVQGKWWHIVQACAENALDAGLLVSSDQRQACQDLFDLTTQVWSREPDLPDPRFGGRKVIGVKKEDIQEAERLIRKILGENN